MSLAEKYKDQLQRLRGRKVVDALHGTTRGASDEEIEAAGIIESLVFQLDCRIQVEKEKAT